MDAKDVCDRLLYPLHSLTKGQIRPAALGSPIADRSGWECWCGESDFQHVTGLSGDDAAKLLESATTHWKENHAPVVVRIEAISEYEVEIPREAFTEGWDLADYVNDTENWSQSAVDGGLGDILMPPESEHASWRRIEGDYWTLPRDESVHGKYGPTGFYLSDDSDRKFKTADELIRAYLAPAENTEDDE